MLIVQGVYGPWHDATGTGWHLALAAQMALSEHMASYSPMRAAAGTHLSTGTSQEPGRVDRRAYADRIGINQILDGLVKNLFFVFISSSTVHVDTTMSRKKD